MTSGLDLNIMQRAKNPALHLATVLVIDAVAILGYVKHMRVSD